MTAFKNHKDIKRAHPECPTEPKAETGVSKDQGAWACNKPGFSFIEIVVTVLLFGTLVTALLLSVNTTYSSLYRFSNRLERTYLLQQRLFDLFLARQKGKEKPEKEIKIKTPATTITYELRDPRSDSKLKKFKNIKIEKVTAQWQFQDGEQTEQLVNFVLKDTEDKA